MTRAVRIADGKMAAKNVTRDTTSNTERSASPL
jgi:hypothetical protein